MSVGSRARPFDWDRLSAGAVPFTGDAVPSDAAAVAIVRSPHPYAEIASVDIVAALRSPGVLAVLTADDFEDDVVYGHRGGDLSDWPPLARGVVRYVGQEVVAVAAESMAAARAGAREVRVEYRPRRGPLDIGEARRAGALPLHRRTTGEPNVSVRWNSSWGDVAAGRRATTGEVAGRFSYPSVAHACMEPNIVVATWDAEREKIELIVSTQAPYFIVKEVARVLGLPEANVVCREIAVGGGFGSKSKIATHEVIAAGLARKVGGRPVLVQWTRSDEFTANKTRHAFETDLAIGFDGDGRFRLFDATITANNGAYNHMGPSVLKVGVITLGSMYAPDGVAFDARLVDTARLPGGPFRGYGTPQVGFALESLVDEVAADLGIDPIDLRLSNLRAPNEPTLCGYQVGSAALDRCLADAREASGWDAHRAERPPGVGMGVAVGMHGSGSFAYEHANRSDAAIDVAADGAITLRFGGADAGTGQRTVLAQIVAAELGVEPDAIDVVSMDSEATPFDMGAWSSRGTQMTGHATLLAAAQAKGLLTALAAEQLGTDRVMFRSGEVMSDGGSVSLGALVKGSGLFLDGRMTVEASFVDDSIEMMSPGRNSANLSPSYAFAAHIAKVHVNERTGQVRLVDYVAAHDLGRPINPTLCEGQIIGGSAMGIGAALGEELLFEGGRVVNGSYIDYPLPRAGDLPDIRPLIVDSCEPAGPHGAKSIGEMSLIPAAPAIANAVADATGTRIRDLPITPDKVIDAIAVRDGRQRRHRAWRRPRTWWVTAMRWLYPRGLHRALEIVGERLQPDRSDPYELGPIEAVASVDDAVGRLRGGAQPIGGGTDLVARAQQGLGVPVSLVSTSRVEGLRAVDLGGETWAFGGAVTLAAFADAVRSQAPGLAHCVETIATPQIRSVATIAGNLCQAKRCWFYRSGFPCYKRAGALHPCYAVSGDHRFYHAAVGAHRCQATTPSDLATALLALDGTVTIRNDRKVEVVGIGELYVGPGETRLAPGDLITRIEIPAPAPDDRFAFEKVRLYDGDFAAVSAAVAIRAGRGRAPSFSVSIGGLAPTPIRLERLQRALEAGRRTAAEWRAFIDAELDRIAHPLPNNAWKLDATSGLVTDLLEQLDACLGENDPNDSHGSALR